jgi:hypothetical protein
MGLEPDLLHQRLDIPRFVVLKEFLTFGCCGNLVLNKEFGFPLFHSIADERLDAW